MLVKKEMNCYEFEFWSGGKSTVEDLTEKELEKIWDYLEEEHEEMDEDDINNFFWFERDFIAYLLGYEDYDEILMRNR